MCYHRSVQGAIWIFFSDLNKAQFYKMPYRDSSRHEIELFLSFNCLNLFIPNESKQN